MRWIKRGVIFAPDRTFPWMVSHAALPVATHVDGGVLRIYFGTRDERNRTRIAAVDVDGDHPETILRLHDRPLLPLGELGTFDDSGTAPSWVVIHDTVVYLYYIGWNPEVTVPYRLSIGLAVSVDGGTTFERCSTGPICDRDVDEPYFNTSPCVLRDSGLWRMWYTSCTGWETVDGRPEPRYHIKYAESADGLRWRRSGRVCIDYEAVDEAIGRPCVFVADGRYKMLYSYRKVAGYRTDPTQSYRLGYAESSDGLTWTRKDADVGIARSPTGWDSQMIEYCYRFRHGHRTYLLYNGNGFGASGFGYAVLADDD